MPARPADTNQVMTRTLVVLMPEESASLGLEAVARMALPILVLVNTKMKPDADGHGGEDEDNPVQADTERTDVDKPARRC